MKNTTMDITAMHRISGVDACAPAGTLLAPTAWSFQGTGLSTYAPSARLRFVGGAGFGVDAPAIAKATLIESTDVARVRTGEPPA